MTPNESKLRELILYIAQRAADDPRHGKTKLYKTLFYADFGFYGQHGKAITDQPYENFPQGPVPINALGLLEEMEELGQIRWDIRSVDDYQEQRVVALRQPDLSEFSEPEIAQVDGVIERLWGKSATEVSRESHEFIGWAVTRHREVIPYETALIDTSPITPDEEAWLNGLAAAGR
jgi:hypothetical protein